MYHMSTHVHAPHTPVPSQFAQSGANKATQPQIDLIATLRNERVLEPAHQLWLNRHINEGMTKHRASEIIQHLYALPRVPNLLDVRFVKVASGHYALRTPEDTINPIKFYKVNTPTEGRWAGRTFVKRYSSDEEMPVRGAAFKRVLADIALNPAEASKLYGQETCRCGVCGRKLTTAESRAYGIGPDCRERTGW